MGVSKEVIQYDLNGIEVRRFKSAIEAANFNNVNKYVICKRIKSGEVYKGFVYKYSGNNNKIDYNHPDLEFKCPYCERHFSTYNGLCKHVIKEKAHGIISKEQLLTDYKYNGERPTCACGCGEYTSIVYEGGAHFADYVMGHHSRVNNNWGHNKVAIEKSAETRREQYKSGERIQWNKGKTWDDTYTEEEQERLLKSLQSQERRRKIRMKLIGKEKSPEHKKSLKKSFNRDEYKKIKQLQMIKRLSEGTFSVSSQIELEFIENCIKPLGIEFKRQYYIKEISHFCDVYIPSKNTIIEFNGDFWHCNPEKYKDGPIHKIQEEKIEKDIKLRNYCVSNNIQLIEIWESDYINDVDKVMTLLNENIIIS